MRIAFSCSGTIMKPPSARIAGIHGVRTTARLRKWIPWSGSGWYATRFAWTARARGSECIR